MKDRSITNELRVLGHAGDVRITWDTADPASCEQARKEIQRLKAAGYLFFLVEGQPADEIAAGDGNLVARYASEADLIPPSPDEEAVPTDVIPASTDARAEETPEPEKKRGRPKGKPNVTKAVAVPPMRGG